MPYTFPFSFRIPTGYNNPELVGQIDYLMWAKAQQGAAIEVPGAALHNWCLPAWISPSAKVEFPAHILAAIPVSYTLAFLELTHKLRFSTIYGVDPAGYVIRGSVGNQIAGKFALEYLTSLHRAYLARFAEPVRLLLMAARRNEAHGDEMGPLANVLFYVQDCAVSGTLSTPQT